MRSCNTQGLTVPACAFNVDASSSSHVNARQAIRNEKSIASVRSAHWNLHIMKIRRMNARAGCGATARISAFRNKCPRWSNLNVINLLYKFTSRATRSCSLLARATSRSTGGRPRRVFVQIYRKNRHDRVHRKNIYKCHESTLSCIYNDTIKSDALRLFFFQRRWCHASFGKLIV